MKKILISIVISVILITLFSCVVYAHNPSNEIEAVYQCPFCLGYDWEGSGCRSKINPNASELEACTNIGHGPCSVTAYYYYTFTYCRDCGYPRQTTSVHRHSVYHSYLGSAPGNPLLVCIYNNKGFTKDVIN